MRSTRLEVDLDALAYNMKGLRAFLDRGPMAEAGGRAPVIAAVIKADAYGLGAVRVAKEFVASGAGMLAVAFLQEALELQRGFGGNCPVPILVMGHTPDDGLPAAVQAGIRLTIFDRRQAELLSLAATDLGRAAIVHIKLDTGMNRLGIKPDAETPDLLAGMAGLPYLELEGIFTHLALCDAETDRRQFDLFMGVVARTAALGLRFKLRHVCDSIGLCRYPEYRLDLVRPGALLFGARPMKAPLADSLDLKLPFAFRTRISRLRSIEAGEGVGYDFTWRAGVGGARIATLPVGYVDGYRRCLSNKGQVLVRGRRANVVGIICMDQLVIDVSGIPDAAEGDEALLFGKKGDDEIGLLEVATWAGTNRNEIFSTIGRRVPRVYLRGASLGSAGAIDSVVDYLSNSPQGEP